MSVPPPSGRCPLVVLISGRGSNLQALLEHCASGTLPVELRAVISNRPVAAGLDHARHAGIPAQVLDHREFSDRASFDTALAGLIDHHEPKLVALAGFMRVLTPAFVNRYSGHMINIHPSLLPDLPGLDTHTRALAEGRRMHGASVHFVTEAVDGGPVIVQTRVAVQPDDTAETLAARVLAEEHRIYPRAIRWYAEGRLQLVKGRVHFEGAPLATPILYEAEG
jgi:phosphoribosylglycinamide formyltransferase-1